MARGRMINNDITKDRKVHMLSDDTSRLAFTWLITFADCEGRTYGDPAIVRSMLFPRREDISIAQMENYIREWANAGLIIWYQIHDELYIYFPAFERNQPGLRKDRESASEFPAPPSPEELRSNDGVDTEQNPVKLKEVKLTEGAKNTSTSSLTGIFCDVTGMITIPSSEIQKVIPAMEALLHKFPNDLTEYLKPFYLEWQKRRTKDGRKYSRTNCTWLYDWAVTGDIPDMQGQNGVTKNADGSMNL